MKIKYIVLISAILVIGLTSNICLQLKISDFISFNLGLIAILVSIISLSIADKKVHKINFTLLAWWEKNTGEWYDVKFKVVNASGNNLYNLILTIVLPRKNALIDNQLYLSQLTHIQSFNKNVNQFESLKVFPVNDFEYVFEIRMRLPKWEDDNIQFILTSKDYESKSITFDSGHIKHLVDSTDFAKAIRIN